MKIHVLSLGCARTLVDSEGLAGILDAAGHTVTEEISKADCVVVNTCAFIREAEEESIATILEVADLKKSGRLKRLYVAGCLPQKRRGEKEDLLELLPEVDGFLGPGDLRKLPELIKWQEQRTVRPEPPSAPLRAGFDPVRPELVEGRRTLSTGASKDIPSERFFVTSPVPTLLFESLTPRRRLTPKHFAYLKISEGCDHACTFCSIPQFRGAHRSRTIEDLVLDAKRLFADGAVELNLVGQDTSYYGADLYGAPRLPQLLRALSEGAAAKWIRVLYAHPAHVTEELISAIQECAPVVKYIDIPIQHIADRLLEAMRREMDGAYIRRMIERFRKEIPGVAIRTTFIVGFPGETEADFEELARFLKEARFERVGMFPYSPEPKTPSERMPNQVPEEVKTERLNHLMELQQGIAEEINRQWLGTQLEVLIDERETSSSPSVVAEGRLQRGSDSRLLGNDIWYLGRTYADAPEVDGQVFLHSTRDLKPGDFVRAKITDTYEYDLVAQAL